MKPVKWLLISTMSITLVTAQNLTLNRWLAEVIDDEACKPKIHGVTDASSDVPGGLRADMAVFLSVTGPVNLTKSYVVDNVSQTNKVIIDKKWTVDLTSFSFGQYNFGLNSTHLISQGDKVLSATFEDLETLQVECELFAGGGGSGTTAPECTGQGVVPDTWIGSTSPHTCTPVIIDLSGDGFRCGGPETAVYFDLLAIGQPLLLQWTLPGTDDAFLVNDINGNGLVDNGSELFGSGTVMALNGGLAPNGFVAMAQHDNGKLGGDGDGYLTPGDAVWPGLMLWVDGNADGVSQNSEMRTLEETGITHLETIPKEAGIRDEHGNWFRYWARALDTANRPQKAFEMVDVYLVRLPGNTSRQ